MQGVKFEFLYQMAIFTLEKDLNATASEIEVFKAAFKNNVHKVGAEMIKAIENEQQKFKINKTSDYIKN